MGAMKSLATEADYASVLRTANTFKEEADRLRALNAELLEAAKNVLDGGFEREDTEYADALFEMLAQAIAKAEGRP